MQEQQRNTTFNILLFKFYLYVEICHLNHLSAIYMHWTIKKKIKIFFTVGVENYFSLKK